MHQPTISCPSCKTEIRITETLAAPLLAETNRRFEAALQAKDATMRERETAVAAERQSLADARTAVAAEVATKVAAEAKKIAEVEAQRAAAAVADQLDATARQLGEAQALLHERGVKLAEAQAAQAEALKLQRALADARRELDLTIERRVTESLEQVRQKARADAEQELRMKVSEREEQIAAMQRQIEDLKRRAEQGSQQLQGEVSELDLEETLTRRFPLDAVSAVGKGQLGADVVQKVIAPSGQLCGTILWECKRTRNWSGDWLPKLRADQRVAGAEIAVLVSDARREVETFGLVDGIWVTDPRYAVPLALALRQGLLDVANVRQARAGQLTKMEMVYEYLTGPKFRHRVEAIVERMSDMQADLDRERKAMTKLWAKRDMQIQGVIEATVGMHGDLQGIAGRAIPEIDGLTLPLIESERFSTAAE